MMIMLHLPSGTFPGAYTGLTVHKRPFSNTSTIARMAFLNPVAEEEQSEVRGCVWGNKGRAHVQTVLSGWSYPFHPDAASLQGVPHKRWLLGQRGAVTITPIQLQGKKSGKLRSKCIRKAGGGQKGGVFPPLSPFFALLCKHPEFLFPGDGRRQVSF